MSEISLAWPKVEPLVAFHYTGTASNLEHFRKFVGGDTGSIYLDPDGRYKVSVLSEIGWVVVEPGDIITRSGSSPTDYRFDVYSRDQFTEVYEEEDI